jgi:hypothetical protein
VRIFATVMLQDSLKYGSNNIAQKDSPHQVSPVLGPLKQFLPDSLQQGIPPYADPSSKPSDSLFAKIESNQFLYTINQTSAAKMSKGLPVHTEKSIFSVNQLRPIDMKPDLLNNTAYNWLTGILFLSFLIYTVTHFLYVKRLKQIFNAAFARRYINQLVREGGLFEERITISLLFIFFSTASIFIFQGIRFILNTEVSYPALTFLAIFAGLFAFWFFKFSIIKFLGFVFKNQTPAYEYNLTSLIYLEVTGLLLLPLSLPAIFQNPQLFTKIGLVIVLLGLLINLIRAFMVGLYNTKFSLFYLILYLCALEILPLVVVVKIFINH